MLGKRMVIDTSKCTACRGCMVACKQWHSLPAVDTEFTGSYTNPPDLTGADLTVIQFTEAEVAGKLRFLFFNNRCRHCEQPTCKAACPLKAIKRQLNGIVRINPDKCDPSLCSTEDVKPCQEACPFKMDGGSLSPIGIPKREYVKDGSPVSTVMRKCDFCYNRFTSLELKSTPFVSTDGKTKSALPACQVTCPPGAIMSGAADTMKRKAKKRVEYLKANGYPNANVYPAGLLTHVLWVLTEAPSVYGIVPA